IIFGALQGLFLIVDVVNRTFLKKVFTRGPSWVWAASGMAMTFGLWCISIIFFKTDSLKDAMYILTHLFDRIQFKMGGYDMGLGPTETMIGVIFLLFLLLVEIIQQRWGSLRTVILGQPIVVRWFCYLSMILTILVFGKMESGMDFIYFKF
ncbi:MAG: hypothetical protein HQL13_06465, partial [Candidatus Omnitrophica bacterium]|nr:hypothetical protein [Candidatus Omnitrophota bacterium]